MATGFIKLSLWLFSLATHVLLLSLALAVFDASVKTKEQPSIALSLVSKALPKAEAMKASPSPTKQKRLYQNKEKKIAFSNGDQPKAITSSGTDEAIGGDEEEGRPSLYRPRPRLINAEALKVPYPSRARAMKIEGRVLLKLRIAKSGHVAKADVISGPAFGLRQAALALAQKMLFLPAADDDGNALISEVEHEVIFRLREE